MIEVGRLNDTVTGGIHPGFDLTVRGGLFVLSFADKNSEISFPFFVGFFNFVIKILVGSYTEVFITEVGVEKAAIFIRSYNTTRTFFRGEINPLCFAFPFTFTEEPDAFKVCRFKELNKGFLFFAIFLFWLFLIQSALFLVKILGSLVN